MDKCDGQCSGRDNYCNAIASGIYGFLCTREKGHTGNHIACGHDECNIETWPQEKQEVVE